MAWQARSSLTPRECCQKISDSCIELTRRKVLHNFNTLSGYTADEEKINKRRIGTVLLRNLKMALKFQWAKWFLSYRHKSSAIFPWPPSCGDFCSARHADIMHRLHARRNGNMYSTQFLQSMR